MKSANVARVRIEVHPKKLYQEGDLLYRLREIKATKSYIHTSVMKDLRQA